MKNSHTQPEPNAAADNLGDAVPEQSLKRQRRISRPWEKTDLTGRLDQPENDTLDEGTPAEPCSTSDRSTSEATAPSDSSCETQSSCQSCDAPQPVQSETRIPRRWDRFVRLVGEEGTRKLMQSHVVVFGLGGVGSYAVEALARSAVGKITLVDFDDVCVTNVNRQIQAFPQTVGQPKCHLLAQRISAINPDCVVDPVQAFYDVDNSKALLSPEPDFVIDAIDNVTAKLHLLTTCLKRGIPIVSATGSGARLDPTQVRVDDITRTRHDPLARVIRKELGRRGFDTSKEIGLPVVFSEEPILEPISPAWDEEGFRCICPHAEDSPHGCEKRRKIYGTASFVTASFGMAASSVAIKHLIGN